MLVTDLSRLLFTGGSGLLGRAFRQLVPEALYPSSTELDVTNVAQMDAYFADHRVDVVVHAAAFTSPPKIDQTPERALDVNIIGTANVVRVAMARRCRLVYISTDYVFRGDRGEYGEDDAMHPVNRYAWSKLGGECAVRLYDNALIIRTSFGPDVFPYPKAFVDQWTSRQAVSAAARDILAAVQSDVTGVLHVGGPRRSVHEYALSLDPTQDIGRLSIKDVSFAVPVDTSLDTSRFRRDVGPVSEEE
jgi:dTDP-4-dehydrorhamnose reductase